MFTNNVHLFKEYFVNKISGSFFFYSKMKTFSGETLILLINFFPLSMDHKVRIFSFVYIYLNTSHENHLK